MITAILAALFLLVPVGATTAYLTSKSTASQTIGGVGRWCSVPNPAEQPNVYRLKDFPTYSSSGSSMIIVPAVRNGEFGSGGGDGRLGVRAWACSSSSLTTGSNIKVTSWRNTSASPALNWLQPVNGSGLPSRRLNPSSGLGQELTKLHREGTSGLVGARLGGDDRAKYAWIMSSGRTKTATNASPSYSLLVHNFNIDPHPTFSSGFKSDDSGTRTVSNSVEYLATAFWKGSGEWSGGLLSPPTAQPVNLVPYKNDITSTDGRQVQWVVIEWWGATAPSDDMVLEVFVR